MTPDDVRRPSRLNSSYSALLEEGLTVADLLMVSYSALLEETAFVRMWVPSVPCRTDKTCLASDLLMISYSALLEEISSSGCVSPPSLSMGTVKTESPGLSSTAPRWAPNCDDQGMDVTGNSGRFLAEFLVNAE
jgi:hypothetical protein